MAHRVLKCTKYTNFAIKYLILRQKLNLILLLLSPIHVISIID